MVNKLVSVDTGLSLPTAVQAHIIAETDVLYAAAAGAGVARFLQRAAAGETLTLTCLGDSILAGSTVTPGVDDALTLVTDALDARFPDATFTATNRAVSGHTVATSTITGYVEAALAAKPDLFIIGFGRNDCIADGYAYPVQGYPLEQAMRILEVTIRSIRRRVPQADIIVMSENPPTVYATDTDMQAYQAAAKSVAAALGCEWVDTYEAFHALGDYSAYLDDAVHPNTAGHALIATTILASMPATTPRSGVAPGMPSLTAGLRTVEQIDDTVGYQGWQVVQTTGAIRDGSWFNTGTWAGSNPFVTSTAADYAEFKFRGTEFAARISTANGDALVVDVIVDGVTVWADQSMTVLPSAYTPWVLFAHSLALGSHTVRLTLKSGTLRLYQASWLAQPITSVAGGVRKLRPGFYYTNAHDMNAAYSAGQTAGWAWIVPRWVPDRKVFDRLAISVKSASANATVTLGLYGADEYDQPAGLILNSSPIALGGGAEFIKTTIAADLSPGWYWLSALFLDARCVVYGTLQPEPLVATASETFTNPLNGYLATGLSALPSVWTSTAAAMGSPILGIRAS